MNQFLHLLIFRLAAGTATLLVCLTVGGALLSPATAQTPGFVLPLGSAPSSTGTEMPSALSEVVTAPPPNQMLSLTEAIQLALSNPAQHGKWQAQQDQAGQAVSLANANLLPQVSAVATANLASTNAVLTPDASGTSVSNSRQRIGLATTYPIFNDGLLLDQRKITEAETLETSATIQSDQRASVNQTLSTFFALLEAQRLDGTQNTALLSAAQLYKTAQMQYQVGTVAKVDVLIARSTYESAVSQADQAADTLIMTRGALAQALGENPSLFVPSATEPDAPPALTKPLAAITAEALISAPERGALDAQRVAQRAQLSAVRARKSPSVSLSSGAGYAAGSLLGRSDRGYTYLSLNLSVPIFNDQAQRAEERSANDSLQITNSAIQANEIATRLAVIQDYALYQSSLPQITAAQASSDAATAALDLAQKEYAVGKGSLSQVELAISAAASASMQLGSALDHRDSALVSLNLLSGQLDPPGPERGEKSGYGEKSR